MIMDRQTLIAIALAIGAMAICAGFLFGPRAKDEPRPTYAVGDIRYSLQQAEAKDRKNRPKSNKKPSKEQFVTNGSTKSGGGEVSQDDDPSPDDSSSDDSSAEEPEAEEPPIE